MIERLQYNAPLAITGAIKGASQQKITMNCVFYIIKLTQLPSYLFIRTHS